MIELDLKQIGSREIGGSRRLRNRSCKAPDGSGDQVLPRFEVETRMSSLQLPRSAHLQPVVSPIVGASSYARWCAASDRLPHRSATIRAVAAAITLRQDEQLGATAGGRDLEQGSGRQSVELGFQGCAQEVDAGQRPEGLGGGHCRGAGEEVVGGLSEAVRGQAGRRRGFGAGRGQRRACPEGEQDPGHWSNLVISPSPSPRPAALRSGISPTPAQHWPSGQVRSQAEDVRSGESLGKGGQVCRHFWLVK